MAKKKKYLRSRAITELQNENIIYYLADNPVYIHNNKEYYEKGLETVRKLLNQKLDKLVNEVHKQIPYLCGILDTKINTIIQACKQDSWESFKQWWEQDVMGYPVEKDNSAIYYLSLLNKIKQQATLIGIYTSARKDSVKTGQLTESGKRKLVSLGFMDVDFVSRESTRATDRDMITEIKKQQRDDLQQLTNYLQSLMSKVQDSYVLDAYTAIQNAANSKNINSSLAKAIGRIEEELTAMITKEATNGVKVAMKNVAAERAGSNRDSSKFKADTEVTIMSGELTVNMLTSDKTGMRAAFGEDGKIIGTIDTFTAGLNITHVEDIAKNMETSVNLADIDPKLGNLFSYILKNANAFNLQVKDDKTLIVSFFAWAKLLTELVGSIDVIDDMPPVIKMFNRLYKTSDIIKRFTNVYGLDIMKYINKTYLDNFYKVYEGGKINKTKLKTAKKRALADMTKTTGQVSYIQLKEAINSTLKELTEKVVTQSFSTSYNIMMDNIQNLK